MPEMVSPHPGEPAARQSAEHGPLRVAPHSGYMKGAGANTELSTQRLLLDSRTGNAGESVTAGVKTEGN